jgi:hypothetical protein
MHCKSCDCPLSDREAVSKDPLTGEYTELCSDCLGLSDEGLIEPETLDAGELSDMPHLFSNEEEVAYE